MSRIICKPITDYLPGVVKIEKYSGGIYVYTLNAFIDTETLEKLRQALDASKCEVTTRYDKRDGLVYIFTK